MKHNYVCYHLHSELSLLDSCTNYKLYVDKAVELGQTAIAWTEHGNVFDWVEKKMYCDKNGIKYIHGSEIYLTEQLEPKVRDNYHTILLAKNYKGLQEINALIDVSTQDDHFYYKPRLSFDEFFNISDNVIKISACLASPLARARTCQAYDRLCKTYDFYEVQPHNSEEQKEYNAYLITLSAKYNKPLIAGTDTHSLNKYKAECRSILQKAKRIEYTDEDKYDLTYKNYDELYQMFKVQGILTDEQIVTAIDNTNVMANTIEEFTLDKSFKYPKVCDDEEKELMKLINQKYLDKLHNGIIQSNPKYIQNIQEEFRVFKKIGMIGFMLFMSNLMCWCKANGIPSGFCRGSVGGSTIAYMLDIIDVDPVVWHTVFSRFCNEDRKEIGDIDVDISPSQRELVYKHIFDEFGLNNTAYILAIGTISDRGTIDEIARALGYHTDYGTEVKRAYEANPEEARATYSDIFYYFDGLINTAISQSMHPAGIVVSPVTLPDNYGTFWNDGKRILAINMEEIHEVSLVKYDILGLKNVEIIKDTCALIGKPYPLSNEIDWNDQAVWADMITSPVGIFQFEGKYAFELLSKYHPTMINHMSIVNAALRPSGASYRDNLIAKIQNHNPSPQIDELLKNNDGYLIFQEDTIKFLTDICGLSGSEADNIRRAIGRKDVERLQKALPSILEGYCNVSDKPRAVAEQEAKAFLQIIEDSSSYQFGLNHSTGYSMIGYMCAYYRYYYPLQFTCAFINNANNEDDISSGKALATLKHIKLHSIKFRYSKALYFPDLTTNSVYQGIANIKYLNAQVGDELYGLRNNKYDTFTDCLYDIFANTSCNTRQIQILIGLGYFDEFGNNAKLLEVFKKFDLLRKRKTIKVSEVETFGLTHELLKSLSVPPKNQKASTDLKQYALTDMRDIIKYFEKTIPDASFNISEQLRLEAEYLGFCHSTYKCDDSYYFVVDINTKYSPIFTLYNLANGSLLKIKAYKRSVVYKGTMIVDKYDIMQVSKIEEQHKKRLVDGEWTELEDTENILTGFATIKKYEGAMIDD